jgi:hypothetical protein
LRLGPQASAVVIAVVTLAGVSVLASQSSVHPPEPAGTQHALRWQGPFEYVREFGSSTPGCAYHGKEVVDATLTCTGTDLTHLRCTASGDAQHSYRESIGEGDGHSERTDAGSYQGALKAAFDTRETRKYVFFRLDVGTTVPVRYHQESVSGAAREGDYRLDVGGAMEDVPFEPSNTRLERHKTVPIYEPGPAACKSDGRFNGTEVMSLRLLPAD